MDAKKYILAIDQGTTSSRAIIFDQAGQQIAKAQKEVQQAFPQNGWVEQNPQEIWQSVQSVIAEVFITSNLLPQQLQAIGITNQRETTIIWDKATGEPIYPAIVWQSKQTNALCQQWQAAGYAEQIHEKTGLLIDSYFSASKIKWILDTVPQAYERACRGELLFGTVDTWLLYNLTGGQVHKTDYTNASRTMLFNLRTLTWDQDLLALLDIPAALLPEVGPSSQLFGYTQTDHFFGHEIPIMALAGDQQAALVGQQAFEPGMVKNTYGTGAFIMMNTGTTPIFSENGLLTTIGYGLDGQLAYALEGSIFVAGSAVQWLRDGLTFFEQASASEQLAQQVSDSDGVYVVPAFTGLGAPYWQQEVQGAMFGLTRGTTKAHITRAVLEAIAYQTVDVVKTMEADSQLTIPQLCADGGASQNQLLMQFQADILQKTVTAAAFAESTALGAAYLAGLASGFWKNIAELQQLTVHQPAIFQAKMSQTEARMRYEKWQKAIKATMAF